MITIVSLRGPTNQEIKGGARNYIEDFAVSLVEKKLKVVILCCHEKGVNLPSHEFIKGVEIIRIPRHNSPVLSLIKYYRKNLLKNTKKLIENMVSYPLFIGLFDNITPKLTIIHHLTGKEYLKRKNKIEGLAGYFMEKNVIRFAYRNIPIVTVSKESVKSLVSIGIRQSKVSCIQPGIDSDFFIPGQKEKFPQFVYIGRYDGENGVKKVDDVIESFNMLKNNEAKLIIAGPTKYKEELLKKISVNKNIKYLGMISEEEKLTLLQRSWAFISPSSREGFGITYIEANLCDTPVIAYEIAALETLTNDNAFLADQGDILELSKIMNSIIEGKSELKVNLRNFAFKYSRKTFSEKVWKSVSQL